MPLPHAGIVLEGVLRTQYSSLTLYLAQAENTSTWDRTESCRSLARFSVCLTKDCGSTAEHKGALVQTLTGKFGMKHWPQEPCICDY